MSRAQANVAQVGLVRRWFAGVSGGLVLAAGLSVVPCFATPVWADPVADDGDVITPVPLPESDPAPDPEADEGGLTGPAEIPDDSVEVVEAPAKGFVDAGEVVSVRAADEAVDLTDPDLEDTIEVTDPGIPVEVSVSTPDQLPDGSLLLEFDAVEAPETLTDTPTTDEPSDSTPTEAPTVEPSATESTESPSASATESSSDPSQSETATPEATESETPSDDSDIETGTTSEDGVTALDVRVDYSGYEGLFAGGYGSRLIVTAYPACFLTTPENPLCSEGVVVPSQNRDGTDTLAFTTAPIETNQAVPALDPETPGDEATDLPSEGESASESPTLEEGTATGAVWTGSAGGRATSAALMATTSSSTAYVVSSGVSGDAGSYGSTPSAPSADWQVGPGSGEFSYSYSLGLPAPAGGSAPSLSLGYSSASVDGMTTAAGAQASQAGIGWNLGTGSITRAWKTCDEQGNTGKGDLCWTTRSDGSLVQHLTISLNGVSGRLVQIPGSPNKFRVRKDPGWRVERVSSGGSDGGVGNSDQGSGNDSNEAFIVTTLDGTKYWFGYGG